MSNRFERVDYSIKELPSGDQLFLNLFRIEGKQKGPSIHIQASVHGAELQGNACIYRLMEYFKTIPLNGKITFIPLANPGATNTKMGTYTYGRFNPVTGHNWNRCYEDIMTQDEGQIGGSLANFVQKTIESNPKLVWEDIKSSYKTFLFQSLKNLESFFAKKGESENKFPFLFLQKVASPADIVIDLHTGPASSQYIYSAEYLQKSVTYFNFPFVLNIPNEYGQAMDEATFMPWIQLQQEFAKHGVQVPLEFESYTLELGSEEIICLEQAKIDALRILHYLAYKGAVNWDHVKKLQDFHVVNLERVDQHHTYLKNYRTLNSPVGGLCHYHVKPGQFVAKGKPMATFLNFKKIHDYETLERGLFTMEAPKDCFIINHCPSSSVSKGMELFSVMEDFKTIKKDELPLIGNFSY